MADAPKYDYKGKDEEGEKKKKGKKSFFVFAEENEGLIKQHIQHLEKCQTETEL